MWESYERELLDSLASLATEEQAGIKVRSNQILAETGDLS
jgi:hypothetical protein